MISLECISIKPIAAILFLYGIRERLRLAKEKYWMLWKRLYKSDFP